MRSAQGARVADGGASRAAVGLFPDRFLALWDEANREFRAGSFAVAREGYRRALEAMAALAAEDGNQAFWRVRLLVDLAGAETERGDPAGALVTLAEAFGIEAHTLPTREHNQGVALLRLGRVEEALRSFDEALAVRRRYAPNFAAGTKDHRREVGDTFCGRGHALLLLGRAEEALPAFEQAIALHPDCLDALAALEALLRAAGRIKESDRALARLTKKRA